MSNFFERAGAALAAAAFGATLLGASAVVDRRVPVARTLTARAPAGARPAYRFARGFASPIQNVVVIVMENRTVDNLFAGYYGQRFPSGGTWGSALDLADPNDLKHPLTENSLSAPFDPEHSRESAFLVEAAGQWNKEGFVCPHHRCPRNATPFSYVPTMETDAYRQIVTNWAFANDVRQANEGPSWPAHQYLIAGQAGGETSARTAPFAQAENPGSGRKSDLETSEEELDTAESPDVLRGRSRFCGPSHEALRTVDMLERYVQREDSNPKVTPCEEYGSNGLGTILDEAAGRFGNPLDAAWQYIAHDTGTIWAAPLGVQHLFAAYDRARDKSTQPFAVDPGAQRFVKDLASANPSRPFARLTYITPCYRQSDHPIPNGQADGPAWLAHVVNAIGTSKYWPQTTIVVVWDDWGGFYDHVSPLHPFPNAYPVPGSPQGNPSDPDEYGFRVPLMVISPYVRSRAFVSTKRRSFSAILGYIESALSLPSLDVDDAYNDDLSDMFDFSRTPLPYVPIVNVPAPRSGC